MVQPLNQETVSEITRYTERIVQFGGGNFLRAFCDWVVQVLNEEADFDSGIVLVKATPGTYPALDEQDCLYHVYLHGIQNGHFVDQTRMITSVNRTVYPYEDGGFDAYMAIARRPEIRFVFSNTTESGIQYVDSDKQTDTPPASFPAKLTLFLHERYQAFEGASDKGCIIIPTELVVDNATKLREIILQYADLWGLDADFKTWVQEHNMFCNTLVDRIIPGYPEAQADDIFDLLGVEDKMLVAGEIYHSWIIEAPQSLLDEFPVNKPAWTPLNVKIVDDASPYRIVKVRLLNGAHTSMVPIGFLLGLESVRESMEHPVLGQFIPDLIFKEVIPSIDEVEKDELEAFARDVFDRFRNPNIHHRLLTIALNTSSKVKARILPSLKGYYAETGELPQRIVIALGAFIRFYKGEWQGETIRLNDDADTIAWFKQTWDNADSVQSVVEAVLSNTDLWGEDYTQMDGLVAGVTDVIEAIDDGRLLDVLRKVNG